MANRLPEVANRYFKGCGIMVIGAEKEQGLGIPKGVEAHELGDLLRPYVGQHGPAWDLERLPVSEDREVLFIIVDPPSDGQSPYPCCKGFQPADKADAKASLADGDIYVRDKSQTRKAKGHEVLALVSRACATQEMDLAVTFGVNGQALLVANDQGLKSAWIGASVKNFRGSRNAEESTTLGKSSPWDFHPPPALLFRESTPRRNVDEQISEFERRVRSKWPECMDLLKAATAPPITFTVENTAASYLSNPQLIITIRSARALDVEDPGEIEEDEILPPVEPLNDPYASLSGRMLRGIRPVGRHVELEWENTKDGNVRVVLNPEALRPSTPWTSDDDELVILATDFEATDLEVDWSLTAEGLGKKLSGTASLPVRRLDDARTLLAEFVNREQK